MQLLYYRGDHPNFGDDLNAFVWRGLAPELFVEGESDADGLLGVGTLIGRPFKNVERIHVFSSGVGYDRLSVVPATNRYWCVRGPLSARALNLPADRAITDGGILAPDQLKIVRALKPLNTAVVVPHWQSLLIGQWAETCELAGLKLVDPMQAPATVIAAIASAPLVLTESLHGAIIADTLRVPWIAIVTTDNVPLFKWFDWTASVRTPLRMVPIWPPSHEALARFGRPKIGRPRRPVNVGEEQAFSHYMNGINADPLARSLDLSKVARGAAARLIEGFQDVSPEGTAKALRAVVSSIDPQLSPSGVVDERKAALLSRLEELREAHAAGRLFDAAPTR
jgi:succinoglycan biosynthesis protein ExoV